MAEYIFRYRRVGQFFWRKHKVVGHGLSQDAQGKIIDANKMLLYFADGSLLEICRWPECDARLGSDFFLLKQKKMEQEAGQTIPVNAK